MRHYRYYRHWVIGFFSFVLLGLPSGTFAVRKPASSCQSYLNRFHKVAKNVGIQVVAVSTGRVVWEHSAGTPLVPASLVKIMTSYAALKQLGPYHHFQTGIWSLDEPKNGTVHGDVWIRSEGDFFLLGEKAWTLACQLKEHGVSHIQGNLYVDNSFFDPQYERICLDGKCGRPYNPVLSPTSMEFNTISFRLSSGEKVGAPVNVEWFPPGDYVFLDNRAKTSAGPSQNGPTLRSLGTTEDGREKFQIIGSIPIRSNRSYEYRFNIEDPTGFVSHSFRSLLQQVGIEVRGKAAGARPVPPEAKRLVSHESPALGDLLYGLNRYSNNFMAEMLMRNLGGLILGPPGTIEKGIEVVRNTLRELGISDREVILNSGSGLSRTCRVSPQAFCRVLSTAYKDFSLGPEFLSSLAMNNHEGTLKKRLRRSEVIVRGKTGTLRNVAGFAGFVSGPEGALYAVAILLNEVQNIWEARQLMDAFLEDIPGLASSS